MLPPEKLVKGAKKNGRHARPHVGHPYLLVRVPRYAVQVTSRACGARVSLVRAPGHLVRVFRRLERPTASLVRVPDASCTEAQ
jgi:hypothetical protein